MKELKTLSDLRRLARTIFQDAEVDEQEDGEAVIYTGLHLNNPPENDEDEPEVSNSHG